VLPVILNDLAKGFQQFAAQTLREIGEDISGTRDGISVTG
jgi:hypothetical protein